MKGKKSISYVPGLFDEFKVEDNYDRWDRLPDLLWGLGFEMDAYNSFREYEKQSTRAKTGKHQKGRAKEHLVPTGAC